MFMPLWFVVIHPYIPHLLSFAYLIQNHNSSRHPHWSTILRMWHTVDSLQRLCRHFHRCPWVSVPTVSPMASPHSSAMRWATLMHVMRRGCNTMTWRQKLKGPDFRAEMTWFFSRISHVLLICKVLFWRCLIWGLTFTYIYQCNI